MPDDQDVWTEGQQKEFDELEARVSGLEDRLEVIEGILHEIKLAFMHNR